MAINKITGSRALLGGIAGNVDLPTCSWFNGTMRVRQASTDSTRGHIQLGGMAMVIKKIALAAGAVNSGTTNIYDTTYDLPRFAVVEDVFLQTITAAASATNTLSVGLAGASSAITYMMTGITPTSAFTPSAVNYRAGGNSVLVSESTTYWYRVPYYTNSATTLDIVIARSATVFSATWTGNLYIKYYVPST